MSKPSETKRIERILIVAITRLGDMLQGSPTIVGLKEEHPDAKITVLIDRQFANVCEGIPGIDEVYVVDLSFVVRTLAMEGEGVVEAYGYVDKMVNDMRERNFDFVLNMSSSPYTAILCKLINAPETKGWMSDEEGFRIISSPWAMLFAAFVFHSNRDFNGLNLVDIFRCAAGVKSHPRRLRYEPSEEDKRYVQDMLDRELLPAQGPLVLMQAGASQEKRQWAPRNFALLSKMLVEDLGARLIFIGSNGERPIVDEIFRQYSHPRMQSFVGKTSIGQLGALLAQGQLLVTGDTGPMHLSVAVGTPVVAMFLASALVYETGPYSSGNLVVQPQISCNPCNPNFPCARPDCHDQASPAMIASLVKLRLSVPMDRDRDLVLPPELARQSEAAIYVTEFDEDGFLECRLLGGASGKRGEPVRFHESARAAYRAVWKEEFDGIAYTKAAPSAAIPRASHPELAGVHELIALADEGHMLLDRLCAAVRDPSTPGQMLSALNASLTKIDRTIEETGLTYGILGALVRIFLMEKENLRGDDVLELAEATRDLYRTLVRRTKRFGQLFTMFWEEQQPAPAEAKRPSLRIMDAEQHAAAR